MFSAKQEYVLLWFDKMAKYLKEIFFLHILLQASYQMYALLDF